MSKPHIFNFFATVNEKSVNTLTNQISEGMSYQNENHAESILIKLSSTGGNLHAGFTFYNFIRSISKEIPVTIINLGDVESIAVIMYLAGDTRLMAPYSRFLLHDFHWTFNAGDVDHSRLVEYVATLDADVKRYCDIFNERTNGAEKPITISKHLHGTPLIVDSATATAAGMAHKIVDPESIEVDNAVRWWVIA